MQPLLGTFVEVGCLRQPGWEQATAAAFAAIVQIHSRLSFHDPTSELSRLNASRGHWLELSAATLRVVRAAVEITRISQGLFNCTVGGELVRRGILPDHGEGSPLPDGHADDIEIDGRRVRLLRPVRVTLDGIAKGWAVDRAVAALLGRGMQGGWVNAGGDLRVFGTVTLPVSRREADGRLTQLGDLQRGALATSTVLVGSDPSFPGVILGTPRPAPGIWSVISRFAYRADALTKVAANATDEAREAVVSALGGRVLTPS
jgi:thiamine biosynthesis lipoprotein